MKFMFELLADGTVEKLCNKIKSADIPYGFGGIAQLGKGDLPAERIIAEHYRLGSSMVILSRSFCNIKQITELNAMRDLFNDGVNEIRFFENEITNKPQQYFEKNKEEVSKKVCKIVEKL